MAREDGSKRTGNRSKTKKKRTPTTVNKTERNTLPRLDRDNGNMERVPSNAPTMAIAPSDYEHIFHEAAGNNTQSPAALPLPPPPVPLQREPTPRLTPAPLPPPPVPGGPQVQLLRPRTPEADQEYTGGGGGGGMGRYAADVQVTPDGYTMLGHSPEPSGARRIALPAHIVRASNQFSRAALQRVARYLASRAEQVRL